MAADTVVLTVRIPGALQRQRDTVAQAMERSRAWVITQAREHFVAVQAWQVAEIHKALAEADAGDFAIAEEIAALNIKYHNHDARLASARCKRTPWNSTPNAKKSYTPP